jgi:hypothetical protein
MVKLRRLRRDGHANRTRMTKNAYGMMVGKEPTARPEERKETVSRLSTGIRTDCVISQGAGGRILL